MSKDGDIRDAIATALGNLSGLPTDDGKLRVFPYILDQVNPPLAMVTVGDLDYDGLFHHGQDSRPFIVILIAGRVADVAGQEFLDLLRETDGPTSVKAAIEDDRTLGGLVDQVLVTGVSQYKPRTYGDITYLTADVSVRVITH